MDRVKRSLAEATSGSESNGSLVNSLVRQLEEERERREAAERTAVQTAKERDEANEKLQQQQVHGHPMIRLLVPGMDLGGGAGLEGFSFGSGHHRIVIGGDGSGASAPNAIYFRWAADGLPTSSECLQELDIL
jgi:hypothetical protein